MFEFNKLREIRKRQKKNLAEVAEKSGLCQGAISLIERGKCRNAGIESVEAIANTLGWEVKLQPIPKVHLPEKEESEYCPTQGTTITLRELMLD